VKHHLANARSKVGARIAQLVWILSHRLPEPEIQAAEDEGKPAVVTALISRGSGALPPEEPPRREL
jgi:hypothetical protein